MSNVTKPSFRYDINGLRAIAIIGVLLFHYKVPAFTGGFAGVDVFFVISGYLMSRVVMSQIDKGTFSYSDYFERRLHRIVPALLFLAVTLTIACFFFYFPVDYTLLSRNAAASIAFISNIVYRSKVSSYFAPSADGNMFLHTWSLSVEWQFYLVYPLVLWLMHRFLSKGVFKPVFIVLTLLLFVLAIAIYKYSAGYAFYLLPARAWEMLFGGLAFFAEVRFASFRFKRGAALVGYSMILASFYLFDEALPWPGFYTLLPVMGTFLIIVANYNNFVVVRHSSMQFIGKISYSLYLWHWPVYVIAQYYGLGTGFLVVAAYCAVAVLLGYLSFIYIESITYRRKRFVVFAMLLAGAGAYMLSYCNANAVLFDKKTHAIAGYTVAGAKFFNQYKKGTCFVEAMPAYKKEPCLCIEPGKKNILLIGDSHMAQLAQSLDEGFAGTDIHFLQATATATLPTVKSYYNKKNNIRQLMDYVYHDFIPKNAGKIDGVIITGNWAGQRLVERDSILEGLKESLAYLKKYNIPVFVIGQTERYTVPYPVVAARAWQYGTANNDFYLDGYTNDIDDYLASHLKGSYIEVLNRGDFPPLSKNNEPYMRDKDHVTKYGADLLVQKIKGNPIAKEFFDIKADK
ncbi:acyltransferase [Flavobacterium zepuense]|uniref:Acyltransferase n=1 Tax=Flavobacterium zepuense TaxID=2593302 RepID=A0A552V2G1_9FLAO|nr:acyltransferase family protein [Flavobacterium zepuense]TRW24654.1 acyltransferase [Flavobacterium zepuense]